MSPLCLSRFGFGPTKFDRKCGHRLLHVTTLFRFISPVIRHDTCDTKIVLLTSIGRLGKFAPSHAQIQCSGQPVYPEYLDLVLIPAEVVISPALPPKLASPDWSPYSKQVQEAKWILCQDAQERSGPTQATHTSDSKSSPTGPPPRAGPPPPATRTHPLRSSSMVVKPVGPPPSKPPPRASFDPYAPQPQVSITAPSFTSPRPSALPPKSTHVSSPRISARAHFCRSSSDNFSGASATVSGGPPPPPPGSRKPVASTVGRSVPPPRTNERPTIASIFPEKHVSSGGIPPPPPAKAMPAAPGSAGPPPPPSRSKAPPKSTSKTITSGAVPPPPPQNRAPPASEPTKQASGIPPPPRSMAVSPAAPLAHSMTESLESSVWTTQRPKRSQLAVESKRRSIDERIRDLELSSDTQIASAEKKPPHNRRVSSTISAAREAQNRAERLADMQKLGARMREKHREPVKESELESGGAHNYPEEEKESEVSILERPKGDRTVFGKKKNYLSRKGKRTLTRSMRPDAVDKKLKASTQSLFSDQMP
eukprot:719018_1